MRSKSFSILGFRIIENSPYGGAFTWGAPELREVDPNFEDFYHILDYENMVVHEKNGNNGEYFISERLKGFVIKYSRLIAGEIQKMADEKGIQYFKYRVISASQCAEILQSEKITDSEFYEKVVKFYMQTYFTTNRGVEDEKILRKSIF